MYYKVVQGIDKFPVNQMPHRDGYGDNDDVLQVLRVRSLFFLYISVAFYLLFYYLYK